MNNLKKYSLYYEGEIDKKIFDFTKLLIIKSKYPHCKEHTKAAGGTIRKCNIKSTKTCCKQIIIMDQDDLNENQIKEIKNKTEKNDAILIISRPSIECVLYAIFDVPEAKLNKQTIEAKLENQLSKIKLKYQHKIENIEHIFNWLVQDENRIDKWKNNLNKLNDNDKSNFIEIFEFFKGVN